MLNNIYNTKAWIDKFIYENPYDSYDQERVNRILESIPSEVGSVLDIGIGGGYIYDRLKKRNELRTFGIDISFELARRLKENRMCVANVAHLPFRNGSFDLVLAADLIEHIKSENFQTSISEMMRVSRKYILINSPYKDTTDWPVSLCNQCKKEFNIYGHIRRVDMGLIRSLFYKDNFDILKSEIFGRKRDTRPLSLVRIARKKGKHYSKEAAICPYCFNPLIIHPPRSFLERSFGNMVYAIFFLMDRLIPAFFKHGSEMIVLLCKKNT